MKETILTAFLTILFVGFLLGLFVAFPVMWLWNNCLVGAITGIHEITFLQAWGLYFLGNLMFKANVTVKK